MFQALFGFLEGVSCSLWFFAKTDLGKGWSKVTSTLDLLTEPQTSRVEFLLSSCRTVGRLLRAPKSGSQFSSPPPPPPLPASPLSCNKLPFLWPNSCFLPTKQEAMFYKNLKMGHFWVCLYTRLGTLLWLVLGGNPLETGDAPCRGSHL